MTTIPTDASDIRWIEQFGAVFDWTPEQNTALDRSYRLAVKNKKISAPHNKLDFVLRVVGVVIILGFIMSTVIILTIIRQPYLDPYTNIVAGIIVGSSAIGFLLLMCGICVARHPKNSDADWVFTSIRIGVHNNVLWIFKHNTLFIYPDKNAFKKVTRVDDFLIANVAKSAAHFLPCTILKGTDEGQKVIDWFEANWPNRGGYQKTDSKFSNQSFIERIIPRFVQRLLIIGIGLLIMTAAVYMGDWWQEVRSRRATASFPTATDPRVGSKAISGTDATDFLDRLIHPGSK